MERRGGLHLGVDYCHATSGPVTFERLAGTFVLIINAVGAKLDADAYLSLLARGHSYAARGSVPQTRRRRQPCSPPPRVYARRPTRWVLR
ncbi:hypothetical protein AB0D74_31645 [Streptomyces sp. NPDC048278]|uniref:hypothetical protein n=1 Tax=Streptomyces sp. NPDC048278 TaxID=3155809 RepID=UPI003441C2CF